MRNWVKPEVKNLGFENTYEDSDLYAKSNNMHFCHSLNN